MTPRTILGTLLTIGAVILAPPGLASAHDDAGTISVTAAEPVGPLAVHYALTITYNNDGHGATDATVTALAEAPGQPLVGPIAADPTATEGAYTVTVTFPAGGEWTVRFSSLSPVAVAERAEVVAPPPISPAPTSTVVPTTTPIASTAPAVTERPPTSTAVPSSAASASGSDGASSSGLGGQMFVVAVAAIVGVGALAFFQARRSRSREQE